MHPLWDETPNVSVQWLPKAARWNEWLSPKFSNLIQRQWRLACFFALDFPLKLIEGFAAKSLGRRRHIDLDDRLNRLRRDWNSHAYGVANADVDATALLLRLASDLANLLLHRPPRTEVVNGGIHYFGLYRRNTRG